MASNTCNINADVMEKAIMARGIKGTPIPRNLISKIVELSQASEYHFIIGSASTLSRKKSFFYEHKNLLKFYDKTGKEFKLSNDTQNEIFMAIYLDENSKEANVYMHFPYDGAYI